MKQILIAISITLLTSGCMTSRLIEMELEAPAHTHFDYETGSYQLNDGYHWEKDPKQEGHFIAVKNK